MSEDLRVGHFAKLYAGAAGEDDVTAMTELDIVSEATVNTSAEVAERRTRASLYPKRRVVGLDVQISFTLAQEDGDTGFELVRDAALAGTPLALCALTAGRDVVGAEGPLADFVIESFERDEGATNPITYSVTANIADEIEEYVEITGS